MKLIANNIQPCTPSTSDLNNYKNGLKPIELNAKVYGPLLYNVTAGFGFNESETRDLIKEAYSCAPRNYLIQDNCHSFRIWLVKTVVRKCIFIISSRLFSQVDSNSENNNGGILSSYYAYINAHTSNPQNMPLSIRAVYILKNMGFDETEIATILNTTTLKVKERFSKALVYMYDYQ